MCLTPLTLVLEKEEWTDVSNTRVVPCGKCVVCLKRRAAGWMFRLLQEEKHSSSAFFITLTYDNDSLPYTSGLPTLRKRDLQLFFKRLRKIAPARLVKGRRLSSIKYYACGEYGSKTQRPHYHAIIFGLPTDWCRAYNLLTDAWKLDGREIGRVDLRANCLETIAYVSGYVIKSQWNPVDYETGEIEQREPEFAVMSKKLGASYLTPQMVTYHTNNLIGYVTLPSGRISSLPRYYKEKIFSESERDLLKLQAKEFRELNINTLFDNALKEVQWKKDQQRKMEKQARQTRQKL